MKKSYLPIICDMITGMKTLLIVLVLVFCIGCGGNGSSVHRSAKDGGTTTVGPSGYGETTGFVDPDGSGSVDPK